MVDDVGDALTPADETANARRRALFAKTPAELTKLLKKAGASVEAGKSKAWYVSKMMELEAKAKAEAEVDGSMSVDEIVETVKALTEDDIDRKLAPYGQMIKRLEDTVATLLAVSASQAADIAKLKGESAKIEHLGTIDDLTHPSIPGMVVS